MSSGAMLALATLFSFSNTVTVHPASAKCRALPRPMTPPPTIRTEGARSWSCRIGRSRLGRKGGHKKFGLKILGQCEVMSTDFVFCEVS